MWQRLLLIKLPANKAVAHCRQPWHSKDVVIGDDHRDADIFSILQVTITIQTQTSAYFTTHTYRLHWAETLALLTGKAFNVGSLFNHVRTGINVVNPRRTSPLVLTSKFYMHIYRIGLIPFANSGRSVRDPTRLVIPPKFRQHPRTFCVDKGFSRFERCLSSTSGRYRGILRSPCLPFNVTKSSLRVSDTKESDSQEASADCQSEVINPVSTCGKERSNRQQNVHRDGKTLPHSQIGWVAHV
jgi:hypothetical protein